LECVFLDCLYAFRSLSFKVSILPNSPANTCICSGKWAQKSLSDIWPSAETLTGLKKQADSSTESFYKLQGELLAKGADVTATFLEFPATKAVIKQTTTALDSLELEAHKSFCNCISDPHMKHLATQFQDLNKQTSEALENVKAHPTALDAKEKYNEHWKRAIEAYAALIEQSPAARDAANTAQKAVGQAVTLYRNYPMVCSWVASGVPGGSLFSVWGMVGVPVEVRAAMMVGRPIAALLLAQMKRDWSPEGCKALMKGVEETAKL